MAYTCITVEKNVVRSCTDSVASALSAQSRGLVKRNTVLSHVIEGAMFIYYAESVRPGSQAEFEMREEFYLCAPEGGVSVTCVNFI